MGSVVGAPWFYWAVGLAVGLPLTLVALTEWPHSLRRRNSVLLRSVSVLRNFLLPLSALLLLMVGATQMPMGSTPVRVVATLLAFVVLLLLMAGLRASLFSGAPEESWRRRVPGIFLDVIRFVIIAVGAGSFKTLVAAVQAAGLVETLKGAGPFTVFAPTDEAFAKLPAGTVESLLKPENKEKLVAVLTYHVVPGKVMAADVVKLTEAPTVQGSKAKVKVADGTVMIDNAKVVKTDIETSNGVIHVIDAVILPPAGK
jgi:hypothetical protein